MEKNLLKAKIVQIEYKEFDEFLKREKLYERLGDNIKQYVQTRASDDYAKLMAKEGIDGVSELEHLLTEGVSFVTEIQKAVSQQTNGVQNAKNLEGLKDVIKKYVADYKDITKKLYDSAPNALERIAKGEPTIQDLDNVYRNIFTPEEAVKYAKKELEGMQITLLLGNLLSQAHQGKELFTEEQFKLLLTSYQTHKKQQLERRYNLKFSEKAA